MYKLTLEQALALLKAVGAPVVEIVSDPALASTEFNADEAVKAIDTARKPIIRSQVEDEVRDTVSKAAAGRMAGTIKSALARATGMTRDELDKYDSGKENELVAAVLAKYSESNPSKDADVEGLRRQIQEITTAHTNKLAEVEASWKKKLEDKQAEFVGRDLDEALAKIVKSVPRTGGDEAMQARLLRAQLEGQYHVAFDPVTKKIELRDKNNHERVVMNESGTQILSVDQVTKGFLESIGVAAKDMSKITPSAATPGAPGQHANGAAASAGAIPVGNFNQDPLAAENARIMATLAE